MHSILKLFRCCILLAFISFTQVGYSSPQLIVAAKTELENISISTARAIFSMRVNQWPNGAPVVVFVLPDQSELHRTFTQKVLSMFPHQLRRNWDRYQYSGTGISPTEVKSPKEMIEKVIATPGAIGYADERFIDERVRILDVK